MPDDILAYLVSHSPEVQISAIESLRVSSLAPGDWTLMRALLATALDENESVRLRAMATVREFESGELTRLLLRALSSGDAVLARSVAEVVLFRASQPLESPQPELQAALVSASEDRSFDMDTQRALKRAAETFTQGRE